MQYRITGQQTHRPEASCSYLQGESTMRFLSAIPILLVATGLSFSTGYRIEQRTQEGIVRTLGKIYRYGDSNTLLALCSPAGQRYFSERFRRLGLANWKHQVQSIGRRIIRGDISAIHILPDGSVRLSVIFYLRGVRRAVPYRDTIVIIKAGGNYLISGK